MPLNSFTESADSVISKWGAVSPRRAMPKPTARSIAPLGKGAKPPLHPPYRTAAPALHRTKLVVAELRASAQLTLQSGKAMATVPVIARSRSGSEKRQRTRHVGVRCTDEQFAAVREKAEAAGMSRSAYVLATMLAAPAPRKRRRLPVVNAELLARGITALNRANNVANQIARELNRQKFMPRGEVIARAMRGQDNGAILAVETMQRLLEVTCAELQTAATAIIRAAGYEDVRRR